MMADPHSKRSFVGVYARDELPAFLPPYPATLICNTDPGYSQGEHWVCVYFDPNGHADYYDPLGLPPLYKEWETYLDRHSACWSYNTHTVQSILSSACGYHVIYYLLWRCRGRSTQDILKTFKAKDVWSNDAKVVAFVNDYYNL